MIKVNYSQSYRAKQKRIEKLPFMMDGAISGMVKKNLLDIKKYFHDGIKDNTFGLDALADVTIKSKSSRGLSKPTTPLYGGGDDKGDRSYANMLIITKIKSGWKLRPSTRKHWSKNISLKSLFEIHEHGAIIMQKNNKGDSILIRIPPRPALLLAYRRYLIRRRKDKKEQSQEVRNAMTQYINIGNKSLIKNMNEYNKREK